jgi:hypothetical protein
MISHCIILKRLAHIQKLKICFYFTFLKNHFHDIFPLTDEFINVFFADCLLIHSIRNAWKIIFLFLLIFAVKLSYICTSMYKNYIKSYLFSCDRCYHLEFDISHHSTITKNYKLYNYAELQVWAGTV